MSSSALLDPPKDGRARRWEKALLYLEIGAGLGDAELEDAIAFSGAVGIGFRAAAGAEVGGTFLGSEDTVLDAPERGDAPSGGSTRDGDADTGGALNGWKDIDERLAWLPSFARAEARPADPILAAERGF